MKPQTLQVLTMLREGPVTTGQFMERYIGRAAARILELRSLGFKIIGRRLDGERSSWVYFLEPPDAPQDATGATIASRPEDWPSACEIEAPDVTEAS